MIEQHHLSERRACRLVGLTRDAYRHPPVASPLNRELSGQIIELAHVRRRFGYRRLHDLLRPAYPQINRKRVYRLFTEAQLTVRKSSLTAAQSQVLAQAKAMTELLGRMDALQEAITARPTPPGPMPSAMASRKTARAKSSRARALKTTR